MYGGPEGQNTLHIVERLGDCSCFWLDGTNVTSCLLYVPAANVGLFSHSGPPYVKAKLSPKCNRGFFCECTRVKPSYKITMKEAILRFTVFLCSGENHLQWECYRHFHDNIAIFRAEQATANMSFFSVTHKHKQCCQCWCSCVETLVMLPAKFHVVSRLLTVLKIENLMPS